MSNTITTSCLTYKISINKAIENYRQCALETLKQDHKQDLSNLDELQAYAYDLSSMSQDLMNLVGIHSDVRFKNFRDMCRDGWTEVMLPDVVEQIKNLNKNLEIFVVVYDDDGSYIGTLYTKDLNF